jgi:hypothetical protein
MRKKVGIKSVQLPRLPKPLFSRPQQTLNLLMYPHNNGKHQSRWPPCVRLGQLVCLAGDALNRIITGVSASNPGNKAIGVLFSGKPLWPMLHHSAVRFLTEKYFASQPKRPAIQLCVHISGEMPACLVVANVTLDALGGREESPRMLIRGGSKAGRCDLLAPQPAKPLLAQADSPRR